MLSKGWPAARSSDTTFSPSTAYRPSSSRCLLSRSDLRSWSSARVITRQDGGAPGGFSIVLRGVWGDIGAMLPRNTHAAHARLLDEVGAVDQVGVEERVAKFTTRSVKREAKVWGLRTAVSMTDLTTLEGKDTPGKVESLCRKAMRPSDGP